MKLSALCPSERHSVTVLQWIADAVIGNGLPVEVSQQIAPRAVGIAISFDSRTVLRNRSNIAVLVIVFSCNAIRRQGTVLCLFTVCLVGQEDREREHETELCLLLIFLRTQNRPLSCRKILVVTPLTVLEIRKPFSS